MNTLWEIDIYPAAGQPDILGRGVESDAADMGLGSGLIVVAGRGFLVQGELTAKQIISAYTERWNIEVFFKDSKQLLGLGQYQNRPYRAAVNHLHLVCFAYALLTHLAIQGSGEKGKHKKAAARSTGELQNALRRIVWNELAQHLKEIADGKSVVKELDRLLVAA